MIEWNDRIDQLIRNARHKDLPGIAADLEVPTSIVKTRWEEIIGTPARQMLDEGKSTHEIADTLGVPVANIKAFRANKTRRQDQDALEAAIAVKQSIEVSVGLERDLQSALRAQIRKLEEGLKIIDFGKEHQTSAGRIDILARDSKNSLVVIELKLGEADKSAVGQTLAYMGALQNEEGSGVRGIIVAESFDVKALSAARVVPGLKLFSYELAFSFEPAKI